MRNVPYEIEGLQKKVSEDIIAFAISEVCPVNVQLTGITYPDKNYHIIRSADNNVFVFEYVIEGEGQIAYDGQWFDAVAGDTYFLVPGRRHEYKANPKNPWKKIWVNFSSDYMHGLMTACHVKEGIYHVDCYALLRQICKMAASNPSYYDLCIQAADCLNKIVLRIAASLRHLPGDAQTIRDTLDTFVYEKIDLNVIVTRLHMSKSKIIRTFKSAFGLTPYDYLLGLKIDTAKVFLLNSGLTVSEIATKLGFENPHYFSSVFLKKTGERPTAYRSKVR